MSGLINVAAGETDQPPLYLSQEDLGEMGYVQMTNYEGKRVWVSPLYSMDGEWFYPPVHIPPGDERRKHEAAMNLAYTEYRRKKKGRGARDT